MISQPEEEETSFNITNRGQSMPDTSNRSSETPTSMGGMRMSENVGPGASVKDIAKNMNFGVMGGMSLT